MAATRVELIPWDPDSPEHIQRLIEHREACGWHAQKVAVDWRDKQRAGTKCIYWIVFYPDASADFEAAMLKHLAEHPSDKTLLTDTNQSLRGKSRQPSGAQFHPVGHISLDNEFPEADEYGIIAPKKDAYWIKSLYVFSKLQGFGIAGRAMDQVESEAALEPLNARHLLLDTGLKEDVLDPRLGKLFYGEVPSFAPHEWYSRRGYREIQVVKDMYLVDEKAWGMRTIIMQRDIAEP